ncbi:hypothetical protein A2930_01840 [Candidatus Giovannonibacteria bacterium RIFCSPLOWO2_01_FULL_45_34]|uniref:Uncharacterized protein n=1 Tax=Candidatus Giovannonibacteria bacterium RIFCSPLOWO2_01_FULL_45_34 TaxID=1798351 RepID=A0A1F5WYG6_9BACT|nr:MAG: hypothetical protein A2930_01840 [Candidatus Giovannonibacteria bacterium RIFCSPLOWO2_01_FULL_45_34]
MLDEIAQIWWVPILLYALLVYGPMRAYQKHVSGLQRTKRSYLIFLCCFSIAAIYGVFVNQGALPTFVWPMVLVGIANGVASYYHWKSMDISLVKNSMLTFGDDIIPMALSYFILNEAKYLLGNSWMISGISFSVIALMLFAWHEYQRGEKMSFYIYLGIYSVLWGGVAFAEHYYSFKGLPLDQFLFSWYGSSFVTATLLLLFVKERDKKQKYEHRKDVCWATVYIAGSVLGLVLGMAIGFHLYGQIVDISQNMFVLCFGAGGLYLGSLFIRTAYACFGNSYLNELGKQGQLAKKDIVHMAIFALGILLSLRIAYWALSFPQVVAQPYFMAGEAIIPALMGIYYWKELEAKPFDKDEWAYVALALLGLACIFIGY